MYLNFKRYYNFVKYDINSFDEPWTASSLLNKLTSLEALLVRNHDQPTDPPTDRGEVQIKLLV